MRGERALHYLGGGDLEARVIKDDATPGDIRHDLVHVTHQGLVRVASISFSRTPAKLFAKIPGVLGSRREQDRQSCCAKLSAEPLLDELRRRLVTSHLEPIRVDDLFDLFLC